MTKAAASNAPRLEEARRHTRQIALHYENFTVVSWLLPRRLRQPFYDVYAFCRHADDLADEIADPQQSLMALAELKQEVARMYGGEPAGLICQALQQTVHEFAIPPEPFLALIDAFEQDQRMRRYQSYQELLSYCRRSADPVGHLVLYLCGYRDGERQRLSDFTCTALQLTNFWQDVASDLLRGRVYLPLEDLRRFGVAEEDVLARRFTPGFRELMRFEVERTRALFDQGKALLPLVRRRVRGDIALFSLGGQAILDRIEQCDYNVLAQRPALGKAAKLGLLLRYLVGMT